MTIGKAKDGLITEVQKQLRTVQKELGFKYIRFHGIFDDEMMVYNEDSSGNPVFNFIYIDQLFDFFVEIGLKPFIELGFMPEKLAREKNVVFFIPSVISMPSNMQKWTNLVQAFILHCMDRYGKDEVEQWYFEFWNEPEIVGAFWFNTVDDYLSFYYHTYKAVKEISNNIQIGGPALCVSSDIVEWLDRYFTFCETEKYIPDFFTFHFYLHVGTTGIFSSTIRSGSHGFILSENPDYLKDTIIRIKEIISPYNYNDSQIHMTEWNSSPSHRDLSHDTLYNASYIVKNILENMDSIGSFGYWTLSDVIEEFPLPSWCFHGG